MRFVVGEDGIDNIGRFINQLHQIQVFVLQSDHRPLVVA